MSSPTQQLLFTGGYAAADQDGINAFWFDQQSGTFTPCGAWSGVENPSFLVVHPNRRWLYTVSENGSASGKPAGEVRAFRFAVEDQQVTLNPLNSQPSNGNHPCHLHIDHTGRWLFVANYSSGTASVLPIYAEGALGEATSVVQHAGSGPNTARQEGPHAHSITPAPDNRFVIVADLGIDQLVLYAFDDKAGTLRQHGSAATPPGAGPRHIAFHPSGAYLYVANELDSTASVYDYDAENGSLQLRESLPTLPAADATNTVADIHINPAGDRLYVSNRGNNSVAVFDVDAHGGLSAVARPSCGGNWPRNFALAPGSNFVVVANERSDAVVALPVVAGAAALGAAAAQVTLTKPTCVQFVPEA